jgi:hypothetical protein
MSNDDNDLTPNDLQAALAEAPAAFRRKLSSLHGRPHVRQSLYITPFERELQLLMTSVFAFHLKRPVAQALVVRLALWRLAEDVKRSLEDPKVAKELVKGLLAVREEQPTRAE